jgi:hypothetical protein
MILALVVGAPAVEPVSEAPGARAAPPRVEPPMPAPVPRVILVEARRRSYYGARKQIFAPGLRVGVGLGARLAGPPADRAHLALDVLAFAGVGLHRGATQAALYPTLGYGLGAGKVTREHLLVAGLGPGIIDRTGGFAVVPALVVGAAERARALGVRTSLLVDLQRQGLVFEVAHQVLFLAAGARHELRFVAAIDLVQVLTGGTL